jgi:RNA polymerase sigma-70 factor, ECF subfamily
MKSIDSSTDNNLLRLMLAGDEDAFVSLYRKYQNSIYRFALQMSGSETVAEDVTQEVFIVLMRDGHLYKKELGSFSSYLYGIARNYVLRYMRKDRLSISIDEDMEDNSVSELIAKDDPLGDLTRNETIEVVRQAILSLPTHYREVIVLCELHEMSYIEAANILECAVGTVRSRLNRARGLLIERLTLSNQNSGSNSVGSARCLA